MHSPDRTTRGVAGGTSLAAAAPRSYVVYCTKSPRRAFGCCRPGSIPRFGSPRGGGVRLCCAETQFLPVDATLQPAWTTLATVVSLEEKAMFQEHLDSGFCFAADGPFLSASAGGSAFHVTHPSPGSGPTNCGPERHASEWLLCKNSAAYPDSCSIPWRAWQDVCSKNKTAPIGLATNEVCQQVRGAWGEVASAFSEHFRSGKGTI